MMASPSGKGVYTQFRTDPEILVQPGRVRFSDDGDANVTAQQGFDAAEAEQIEERLRGLGYL